MTPVEIRPDIAARLQERAEIENRSVDDVLDAFLSSSSPSNLENIEIPSDMRPMLYRRARRYWTKTNNQERLALTDKDLDEQFWVFDTEGIPRLKSDQAFITLPDDPLLQMAEAAERNNWHSGQSDISENFDQYLKEITPKPHE